MTTITATENSEVNEDTKRMQKLIGKSLTRIEISTDGGIYLEFDPYGSIRIRTTLYIDASVLADAPPQCGCGSPMIWERPPYALRKLWNCPHCGSQKPGVN